MATDKNKEISNIKKNITLFTNISDVVKAKQKQLDMINWPSIKDI